MPSMYTRRGAVALLAAAPAMGALAQGAPAGSRFAELGRRWLDGDMRLSPVSATRNGDHRFDGEIDDLTPAGRAAREAFLSRTIAELAALDRGALSRAEQVDAAMLEHRLRGDLWEQTKLQPWAWDPLAYSAISGGALYNLVAREYAPLPDRLRSATARMRRLPAFFAAMRANLVIARVPRIHAETAAGQGKGVMSLVDGLILPQASVLPPGEAAEMKAAAEALRVAAAEHQTWLEGVLLPGAKGDFRLGAELFDDKLGFDINTPLTRPQIKALALADLAATRKTMYAIARKVMAGRPGAPAAPDAPSEDQEQAVIAAALDLAAAERAPRDQVVAVCEASLARATAFVRAKNLISLPDAPVQVIVMPEFQRGVAVAYCDSPGPLDKSQSTFYAVSPIPEAWTEEQTTSFLREYNTRAIHELTIHEAMPGHYVQLARANTYPSTLRGVLASGPFIEGWGMYAEDVMADAGYLDGDPLYLLVHLKWRLRATANAVLDQGVHVDGMTEAEAMRLMTRTAFQEEREAAGKWTRARVSSAQLHSYFVGYQEHIALRRDAEKKAGAAFDLKAHHDRVTGYGSPPVRYVQALMFDEKIA